MEAEASLTYSMGSASIMYKLQNGVIMVGSPGRQLLVCPPDPVVPSKCKRASLPRDPVPLLVSDYLTSLLEVPRKFTKESTQLLQRCTKPDKRGTPRALKGRDVWAN